jgi:leucyl-tRNA synthetase
VPFTEPFPRIRLGGLIIKDGARMSKSRGNVISPDGYVQRHGSDVLRCALLFSAPWEQGGDFVDDAIGGIERFFTRVWKLAGSGVQGRGAGKAAIAPDRRPLDAAIVRATDAMERLRCNVALAAAMELTGWLEDQGPGLSGDDRRDAVRTLILLLAPLAPHLAEELWTRNGGKGSVHVAPWPQPAVADPDGDVELVIQVDGRVRDRVDVPSGLGADGARDVAVARPKVQRAVDGREVRRVVHVVDRLINLVTT